MMEIKKFEAPTLAEALRVVKRELGPDAIVLTTKNNKGGWGLMNKASVEVTATVNAEALERKERAESGLTEAQRRALAARPARRASAAYDVLSGARVQRRLNEANSFVSSATSSRNTRAHTSSINAASQTAHAIQQSNEGAARPQLTQRRYVDIRDDESPAEQVSLRSHDRAQIDPSSHSNHKHSGGGGTLSRLGLGPQKEQSSSLRILPKLLAKLVDVGIEESLIRDLGDELKTVMLREHITREDLLQLQLARIIMSRLRVGRSLSERLRSPNTPRIITFLGPTGVGKTTTIAKIAAELVINQSRPVTLATTDTYKIAAVEQLQTYANILGIPLEVCPNTEAIESLRDSLSEDAVVLLDTAGFGPRDDQKLTELREMISTIRTETHLCVSSTTRDSDLLATVKRFGIFDPDYLVFTKLDETEIYGNIFNLAAKTHVPLSYFTMGQRVPEDMELATKERVADLILDLAGGGTSWTKQID